MVSEQLEPYSDTAAEADNTWTVACAETAVGHIYSDAGHAAREMPQRRESLIVVCDMTSEGRAVGAYALRPSCRKYL